MNIKKACKDIYFEENYVPLSQIKNLKHYFDETVNDWFSNGPKKSGDRWANEWVGCFDRPLRLERDDNPLLQIIAKLKEDFGDFVLFEGSIRYMSYPFPPHTDVRNSQTLIEQRQNHGPGRIFIIPLWWDTDYVPGTAFFSTPPKFDEPMYIECADILPASTEDSFVRNFSVSEIYKWKNPGDLLTWKNFKWHSSLTTPGYNYSHEENKFCKEFISIETWGITKNA